MILLFFKKIEVLYNTSFILLFDLIDSHRVLDKLVKSSMCLRYDLILYDLLCLRCVDWRYEMINILDEMHWYNLMWKLIIVFVDEPAKLKVKHHWASVLCVHKPTVLDYYLFHFVNLTFENKSKYMFALLFWGFIWIWWYLWQLCLLLLLQWICYCLLSKL